MKLRTPISVNQQFNDPLTSFVFLKDFDGKFIASLADFEIAEEIVMMVNEYKVLKEIVEEREQ